ncbi:hypothetical protein D3C80_1643860 [compost metagenome]
MLAAQALDLVIYIAGLHRTTAWAIDPQDDALGALILERGTQSPDNVIGTPRLVIGDHPLHFDQRRVTATARGGLGYPTPRPEQRQGDEQVEEGQQLEEYPPTPRPPLLLDTGQHGLFQQLPALVVTRLGRIALPFIRHAHSPRVLIPPRIHSTRRATH